MFVLKTYNIPIDLIAYEILKFVSYWEIDNILQCFQLVSAEIDAIKYKIYAARLEKIVFNNRIEYSIEHKLHRENDLPAIEYTDGTKSWWLNGKRHRENDLPAVEYNDGDKLWFINGIRHRENDLPAIIRDTKCKEWYKYDRRHRENDLPAVEYVTGYKAWYLNGKRHRDNDLPAVIKDNGEKEWWNHGKFIR